MGNLHETLPTTGNAQICCYDKQYRPTFHGPGQRYVSPTTGKCRPLVVQAVRPDLRNTNRTEIPVGGDVPAVRKLAVWLVKHLPSNVEDIPRWLWRWAWFTIALGWPFTDPRHTGVYSPYLSRFYGQLWAARSPREYSLRTAQRGVERVHEITHLTYPRRLIVQNPRTKSWGICDVADTIKNQRYVAISYTYSDVVPRGTEKAARLALVDAFVRDIEATMTSLGETAYWTDLKLINTEKDLPEEVNEDVYRMADVYRSAKFTLIMFPFPAGVGEDKAWLRYGKRLWTFPEALLSKELRFKFTGGNVIPVALHQLANLAYKHSAEESAIVNAYGLKDPLERLERLSMLKSALWRRTSGSLERHDGFEAERVYALMGFFEHRIHPDFHETELQALARLSMANDNDRIVERMVSLLPPEIPETACWYAEKDEWGANLWDIDPEIQVVGMTKNQAIVLGGCRAATIRWKNFPAIAFATRPSLRRLLADYFPNLAWEIFLVGIILAAHSSSGAAAGSLILGIVLVLLAPLMKAYAVSGRIVGAQPWLIGVKGLISAEEAATLLYGGSIGSLPRTFYSPSGTPLARNGEGEFRRGDPKQLEELMAEIRANPKEENNLYSLVDTVSATIYYFRAARPPTVCLYTGKDSGMGRFVLCSERCAINELHKETVIRMPWYISQLMGACDWVALG